jgi:hypothetical protein
MAIPANILEALRQHKVLEKVVVPPLIAALLETLKIDSIDSENPAAQRSGMTNLAVDQQLSGSSLNLVAPGPDRAFSILCEGPPADATGFVVVISLHEGPAKKIFELLPDAAGRVLKPAVYQQSGEEETLTADPTGGKVALTGTDVFLIVEGKAGQTAELKFAPSKTGKAIVHLQVSPQYVMLGDSPFGLEFAEGLVIDLADDAAAPGETLNGIPLQHVDTPADALPWKGIAVRNARFFLPKETPLIGGRATHAHLQIGWSPTPGLQMAVRTQIAASGSRPAIDVLIECMDPTAQGLSSIVPTLVEASMQLPLDKPQSVPNTSQTVQFMAGHPVRARARFARKPGQGAYDYEFSLAIESQGDKGIASVKGSSLPTRMVVSAATLGTAMMAEPGSNKDLGQMLAFFAGGLSTFLEEGELVVHGAEVAARGRGLPKDQMAFRLDYSTATQIRQLDVGVMQIGMAPAQPLRLRVRDLELQFNPGKPGLEMISLDYSRSNMEIEDPGRWMTSGTNLFDILGSRSGHGSMWYEIDLGFRINLGPVKVSGATVRAKIEDGHTGLSASFPGVSAGIDLKPMVTGDGSLYIESPSKFRAHLGVNIQPLGVSAKAEVDRDDPKLYLRLAADFPGPIPLANSGLAIYGIGGSFCSNGIPDVQGSPSPSPQQQLAWRSAGQPFKIERGSNSFGIEAVIGTAPDLGYSFSAIGAITVTTPRVAMRAGLDGVIFGERKRLTASSTAAAFGAQGLLLIDENQITIAMKGEGKIPVVGYALLKLDIPVSAHFPLKGSTSDWYLHIGADGYNGQGRESGPVRATLLPGLLEQHADAYVMFRGGDLTAWPRGEGKKPQPGPLIAAGFGFDLVMGVRHVVWAEVFARADFLLTARPASLVGQGTIGGKLGVGVFSVGVDGAIEFEFFETSSPTHPPRVYARVCGVVDLFFKEVRKCVDLKIGEPDSLPILEPPSPLDHGQGHMLVDDLCEGVRDFDGVAPRLVTMRSEAPTVWPDAIPLVTFGTPPKLASQVDGPFATAIQVSKPAVSYQGNNKLRYEWTLRKVLLTDVTDPQAPKPWTTALSCAWQASPFAATGNNGVVQLAMLTGDEALFLNALPDGGAGLSHEPLKKHANLCEVARPQARPGWAIGEWAERTDHGWRMPPDRVSTDPLHSNVVAHVRTLYVKSDDFQNARVLDDEQVVKLPVPYQFEAARIRRFNPAREVFGDYGRSFEGGLAPSQVSTPLEITLSHHLMVDIEFEEELIDPVVWLVVDSAVSLPEGTLWPFMSFGPNDAGAAWQAGPSQPPADGWLIRAATNRARRLAINAPAGLPLCVLGVHGMTVSARNAQHKQLTDLAKKVADKQSPPPPDGSVTTSTSGRCVLEPGKTYELAFELEWAAFLDNKPAAPAPGVPTTKTQRYYFRTAALKPAASWLSGALQFEYFKERQREFEPAMLERHLGGYEPAQSVQHWFRGDPMSARFLRGHVAGIAKVYGYTLSCGLRRLDKVEPSPLLNKYFEYPKNSLYFTGGQKAVAEAILASPCGFKPPGIDLVAEPQNALAPQAWYELYVAADPTSNNVDVKPGRLSGVTVRTSRWIDAAQMLEASGFRVAGSGKATGDAEITTWLLPGQARSVLGRDAEFEMLLRAYGIDGWPLATEPRTSLLWADSGGWKLVGAMVESPEPIHRPGRAEIATTAPLVCEVVSVVFDVIGRDRTGSRLLFATTAPFVPPNNARLRLTVRDLPRYKPAVSLAARLRVPAQPLFAS